MSRTYSIETTQTGPHEDLEALVRRYQSSTYQRPIPPKQQAVFHEIAQLVSKNPAPLILDSGCGTGLSTHCLAERFPEHLVIGVDKSDDRLTRSTTLADNARLFRADLIDLWRLIAEADWTISLHTIFYPNPWPKHTQLKRRFHAHPVFSACLNLAPRLLIRSDWKIYLEEFEIATHSLNPQQVTEITPITIESPLTRFEEKYKATGRPVYQLSIGDIGEYAL